MLPFSIQLTLPIACADRAPLFVTPFGSFAFFNFALFRTHEDRQRLEARRSLHQIRYRGSDNRQAELHKSEWLKQNCGSREMTKDSRGPRPLPPCWSFR
jgi:hypothetical protein